jgi:hypothetical protein
LRLRSVVQLERDLLNLSRGLAALGPGVAIGFGPTERPQSAGLSQKTNLIL